MQKESEPVQVISPLTAIKYGYDDDEAVVALIRRQ